MRLFIQMMFSFTLAVSTKGQYNPYLQEPTRVQADSLRDVFQNTGNDSLRMYTCRMLGLYYQEINRDSSFYFYEQQLLLAQKLKLKIWEAEALNRIAYVSGLLGNYPYALKALLNAKEIIGNKQTEKNIWNIAFFSKAKNREIARLTVAASIEQHIGHLYLFTADEKKALAYYFECLKIAEFIGDKALLSIINISIGEAYLELARLDSALISEQKALQYCNESGYNKYEGFILYLIAKIYEEQNEIISAKKYYNESLEANLSQKSFDFAGASYISLASLALKERNIDFGVIYGKQGLKIYEELNDPVGLLNSYQLLSSVYKLKHDIDSAFYYQELANITKDSLNKEEKVKNFQTISFKEELKLQEFEKERIQTQNRIRTYAMLAGLGVFSIIAFIFYRNNRQKQKANKVLEKTLSDLKATQGQLIQQEKMASLGELTAGIAHEIQNPLNFVNNFSEVNNELISELVEEVDKGNLDEVRIIANDIKDNEQKINHHGKRADAIVKGMLQHSRTSTGIKEPTDINKLADEYLRLSYHGMRAKDKEFNADIKTQFDENIRLINIVAQDIGRVLLNLFNNAFYAVNEKAKTVGENYQPTLTVATKHCPSPLERGRGEVKITVADNGNGIPQNIIDKIFQPFFTTKPTGQGTGLGLSLTYDIIRAHGGEIKVETKEGKGSEFIIQLPV